MYRIELSPNEVAAFRTIEEMATAIRSGAITPKARIYHGATDKWLPIEFHPHYKKALALIAQGVAEEGREPAVVVKLKFRPSAEHPPIDPTSADIVTMAAAEPDPDRAETASLDLEPAPAAAAPPKRTREIEFLDLGPDAALRPPAPRPEPLPRDPTHPAPIPITVVSGGEIPVARRRWRGPRIDVSLRSRRPYLIALAGMMLVLVTHVALPAELPPIKLPSVTVPAVKLPTMNLSVAVPDLGPARETARPSAAAAELATHAPAPAVEPVASGPETPKFGGSSVRGAAPSAPPVTVDTLAAAPAAPKLTASSLADLAAPTLAPASTAGTLADRYASASARLRAELDLGLRNAKFAGIFESKRLETPAGVSALRTSVATAASHLRTYERRAADLERAYRDSAAAAGGNELRGWNRRRPQEDATGAARLVERLVATIDSLYGILAAQDGKYLISRNEIAFTDLAAAQEYGAQRRQLERQLDALDGSPVAGTIAVKRVLAAIGGGRMPVER